MLGVLLVAVSAFADVPVTSDEITAPPIDAPELAETPVWSGGSRDRIFGIVGVEGAVRQLGSSISDVHLLSAELDWGDFATTPAKGPKGIETSSFSHSSLTVTRQRVADSELMDSVRSLDDDNTYDLSNPNERARLCARMPGESRNKLDLHTWTSDESSHGQNDLTRRGDNPSILMAEDDKNRTAMVALQPGESVTLVEFADSKSRKHAQRRLQIKRDARTLSMTEGATSSKVCLEY